MKSVFGAILCGSAFLLFTVSWAVCGPVNPFGDKKGYRQSALEPFGRETHSILCNANESTRVMVYGQGSSPMAVYVYDVHGNCVARDDVSLGTVSDDLALEWFSPTKATYQVEVRNLGRKANVPEIAIR